MFCPSCANPIDGAQKFCRSCGANVSLVPQAMTGRLPEVIQEEEGRHGRRRRRDKRPPTIEGAVSSIFAGIGFLAVSLAVSRYAPAGQIWWFWMLIPAFSCIGSGVGQYLKLKEAQRQPSFPPPPPQVNFPSPAQPQPRAAELSAPTTSELINPSSVTEQTTRHLEKKR
ncbi:MAG: zinc ribbon domain-containing protein [Acidobacteriota bacterium]